MLRSALPPWRPIDIQQPRGSLSGPRVVYNMKTGMVNSSADSSGRVKMTIQPRQGAAAPAPQALARSLQYPTLAHRRVAVAASTLQLGDQLEGEMQLCVVI